MIIPCRIPFLAGETDLDQLGKIFLALGTPTEESWPGLTTLPDYIQFKKNPGTPLGDIFTAAGDDLLDLMEKLVTLYPLKRINSTTALKHRYFSNKPAPSRGDNLPLPPSLQQTKIDLNKPGTKRKLVDTSSTPFAKKLVF